MWVFNIFLYMWFLSNPPMYKAAVEAGAPCYAYRGDVATAADAQPACFYDLKNTNSGLPVPVQEADPVN